MRTSASTCARYNEAHILMRPSYVRTRALSCVRACVREGWQPRREISYEITGSHCRGSPLGPLRPPRGRSLICNEPAPPVIILRLRDHVITRARIGAVDSSRAWFHQKRQIFRIARRFFTQFVWDSGKRARVKFGDKLQWIRGFKIETVI